MKLVNIILESGKKPFTCGIFFFTFLVFISLIVTHLFMCFVFTDVSTKALFDLQVVVPAVDLIHHLPIRQETFLSI